MLEDETIATHLRRLISFFITSILCTTALAADSKTELSLDDAAEAIHFVELEYPYKLQAILQLKNSDPTQYNVVLKKLLAEKRYIERIAVSEPKAYAKFNEQRELDRQAWQISQKCREITDPKIRAKLFEQLQRLLSDLFDTREQQKSEEIARLQEELKKLQEVSELRKKSKDQIVNDRMNELLKGQVLSEW